MSQWNFADVWETVADALPDAPALTHGTARLTWSELDRRADSLARWLLEAGVGRQDKVALYLYNCPEYLEATFACLKLGLVPINTNYRYADDELVYLWDNADTVAVVFHGTFAERIERIRAPGPRDPDVAVGRRRHRQPARGGPSPTRRSPSAAGPTGPPVGSGAPGAGAPTTSTCSTPGAPPGCPRASCGARTTCSPGSTARASGATPRTAGPTTCAPSWSGAAGA